MKRSLVFLILFCGAIAQGQGKYRPGQYPLNQNPNDYAIDLHISAIHVGTCATVEVGSDCEHGVRVNAILNGKKLELSGGADQHQLLLIAPGDYRARLYKKPRAGSNQILFQQYYVLLGDKSAWRCEVTGFSE